MPNQTVNYFRGEDGSKVHADITKHYVPRQAVSYHLDETSQALAIGKSTRVDIDALKKEYLAPSMLGLLSGNIKVVDIKEQFVGAVYQEPIIQVTPAMKFDTLGCAGDAKYCGDSVSSLDLHEEFQLDDFAKSFKFCEDDLKEGCGRHPYAGMATKFESHYTAHRDVLRRTMELLMMRYIYDPKASNLAVAEIDFSNSTETKTDFEGNNVVVIDHTKLFRNGGWYTNITTTLPTQKKIDETRGHSDKDLTTKVDLENGTVVSGYEVDGVTPKDITSTVPLGDCSFTQLTIDALMAMTGVVKSHMGDFFQKPAASFNGTYFIMHPNTLPMQTLRHIKANLLGSCADITGLVKTHSQADRVEDNVQIVELDGDLIVLTYDAPRDVILGLPRMVIENTWLGISPIKEWSQEVPECQSEERIFNMRARAGWFLPESYRKFVYKITLPDAACSTLPTA